MEGGSCFSSEVSLFLEARREQEKLSLAALEAEIKK